jgi:hypothetical protein
MSGTLAGTFGQNCLTKSKVNPGPEIKKVKNHQLNSDSMA